MKSRYSRNTDPGPGEVEEEYCDELAEDSEINDGVLGAVESEGNEVLDGGEGKLGGDVADGLLVAPAKLVSTFVKERRRIFSKVDAQMFEVISQEQ